MQFIVITGLSGAGKGLATAHFEDLGFYCADNLPPALIPAFVEECARQGRARAAVVVDARSGDFLDDLDAALQALTAQNLTPHVLFLEADDDLLLRRFKETRRRHPLSEQFPDLPDAMQQERAMLEPLRARADKIVNTSHVTPRELREEIRRSFVDGAAHTRMTIRVQSFGFKHGAPNDADMMFDARFLPNPNYDRAIRHLNGTDAPVIDYVMREPVTQEFLSRLCDLLLFCVPQMEREGKSYLTIAIGCTGGRHRSVALTNFVTQTLREAGHEAQSSHRDLERSAVEARNFVGPTKPDATDESSPQAQVQLQSGSDGDGH